MYGDSAVLRRANALIASIWTDCSAGVPAVCAVTPLSGPCSKQTRQRTRQ